MIVHLTLHRPHDAKIFFRGELDLPALPPVNGLIYAPEGVFRVTDITLVLKEVGDDWSFLTYRVIASQPAWV